MSGTKHTKDKRSKRVVIYLSQDEFEKEYRTLRAKLTAIGSNFSDWVRSKIIEEAKK